MADTATTRESSISSVNPTMRTQLTLPASTVGLGKVLPVTATFAIPLVVTSSLLSLNVVKTRIELNTWQGDKVITKEGGKEAKGIKQPDGKTHFS